MSDWRITNQKNYLDNVTLLKTVYNLETHDHCAFCWEEFKKGDIGYCTEDEYHWICKQCFDDLNNEFKWKIKYK